MPRPHNWFFQNARIVSEQLIKYWVKSQTICKNFHEFILWKLFRCILFLISIIEGRRYHVWNWNHAFIYGWTHFLISALDLKQFLIDTVLPPGNWLFLFLFLVLLFFLYFFFHLQELPAKKFNAHSIYASANDPPFSICSCNSMPFKFTFNSPVSFLSVSPLLIHDDRIFFLLFFFFVFIFSFLFSLIIRCH